MARRSASDDTKGNSGRITALQALGHIGLGKERIAFVQNLATLLNAGLPITDCLKTLELETRTKPMRKIYQQIRDSVERGNPLWQAMDDQRFFSPYVIALVRIGEEAGSLAKNMEYLALQQEKDQALKSKVKMAMIYPAIVLVLVLVVVIGLGGFVLPSLVPVLHSLGGELPLVTRIVIGVSDFFTQQGAVAIPLVFGGMLALMLLHIFTRFREVTQWLVFRIPGVGRLAREATIARFGVILGGLLQAGVPLVDALVSLEEVTTIVVYRRFYGKVRDGVSLGQTFQRTFKAIRGSTTLLPISVQQLVLVGEQSGSLATILLKIADIYDRKASETAQKLPVILEPMLLLFMGGLVGTIAFAIIMPIYDVVGSVGR
ncbi:MAG: type IV pilus assembly protein PilC [Candidatus Peregrinibacteria bacterium Gr01-1014_25]|nr:MAG: type IV pilus assembly protein PilC [Candidatus Peregrinibacteria bacterium Gr01-1014_25]